MSQFDTNKWFKKQYLTEAGLNESKADSVAKAMDDAIDTIDPELSVKDFAIAVGKILKGEAGTEGYGSFNFSEFMKVLHAELGIEESLNEAESTDIERLDFAFVDGTTKLYAVYVYKKGGKGVQWDKKLSRKEAQELLNANNIDIEINPYNIDKIDDALKDIKVIQSEFDVS